MSEPSFTLQERRAICLLADQELPSSPALLRLPGKYATAVQGLIAKGLLMDIKERSLLQNEETVDAPIRVYQHEHLRGIRGESRCQIAGALLIGRLEEQGDDASAVIRDLDDFADEETGPITEREAKRALAELKHYELVEGTGSIDDDDIFGPTLTYRGVMAAASGLGPGDYMTRKFGARGGPTMNHNEWHNTLHNSPVAALAQGDGARAQGVQHNTPTAEAITAHLAQIRTALDELSGPEREEAEEIIVEIEKLNQSDKPRLRKRIPGLAAELLEVLANIATVAPAAGALVSLFG